MISISTIVDATSRVTGIAREDIVGPSRFDTLVRARAAVVWVSLDLLRPSHKMIGRILNRGPETICDAKAKSIKLFDTDKEFRDLIRRVRARLYPVSHF